MFSRRRPCLAWSGHGSHDHFIWKSSVTFRIYLLRYVRVAL
jgi:hypothetical protein